jgi:hypothetical protein
MSFKDSPLGGLARLRDVRTKRASSWDRTGGNKDFLVVQPGETATLSDVEGPGCINHIWCTHRCAQEHYLRRLVVRMWWDGEDKPSVEAPLGDFFGVGHAQRVEFASLPLQMSPARGQAFNCWFPMPFASRARIELTSEAEAPTNFYYYVDYELHDEAPAGYGRFHAQWRRQNPTRGVSDEGLSTREYSFGGTNIGGENNYVILEAEGKGHYVGCNLNIHNLRRGPAQEWPADLSWPPIPSEYRERRGEFFRCFNWYGEGDDMIFIDGEPWPPSLHGTGTEDYFNTAYCPATKYDSAYHGVTMPGGPNWSGRISLYRFHIEDPIHFQESIRVTIEHGHANRRSDDYSSTAYWYQAEPHGPFPELQPVEERLPRDEA